MIIEGVTYEINWENFPKGSSFFIPCVNPIPARNIVIKILKRLKMTAITKVVIEDGIKGVRFWRI